MIIEKTLLQSNQPSSTNVLWARPVDGGLLLYVYNNGRWCPVNLPDDKGTGTTADDGLMSLNADNIRYLMPDGSTTSLSEYVKTLDNQYETLNSTLSEKVDKETGKGLSTNDYTTTEKNKLAGIASGAEVNVQSDWKETNTSSDTYIKNKPTIPTVPTAVSAFTNDAGYLTEHQSLDGYAKETDIVQSDWNESTTTSKAYIKNKPSVYTQSDVDTKLNAKADSSTVTTLSDTVSKLSNELGSEIDRAKQAENTNADSIATNTANISSNTARIETLENKTLLDQLSYGVEWDVTKSTPKCTRVGNMQMHKTLPIQSTLRGCIFTKDGVKYYLDPNDWSKKADGTEAKLDGTDGDVGVHHMKFYIRSWTSVDGDSNRKQVRISPYQIDGSWYEVKEGIISAYCATVDTTDSSKLLARSVVSDAANMRGGNNSAAKDTLDDWQTNLGKPRTSISRATFRTYARNNGYELLDYTTYKNCIYWLFVIEYATFYNQDTLTDELTSEGYHQGGLGTGLTSFDYGKWTAINGCFPLVKNGCTDSLGNGTGEITVAAVSDYEVTSTNRDFGSSDWGNDNSSVTRNTTNKSVTFTQINFGGNTSRQILHTQSSRACGTYVINVSGLADSGITLSFRQGNTVLQTVSEDGDVTVTFDAGSKDVRTVWAEMASASSNVSCNISLTSTTVPDNVATKIDISSYKLNRYRGIELPFGNIWLNVDGVLGYIGDDASKEDIYVTDNPDYYSESDYSNMRYIGTMPSSNYIKALNIGEMADIVPLETGANSVTYMTDSSYKGSSTNTYHTLLLGGSADYGSAAGLGYFVAGYGVTWARTYGGFRLCLKVE